MLAGKKQVEKQDVQYFTYVLKKTIRYVYYIYTPYTHTPYMDIDTDMYIYGACVYMYILFLSCKNSKAMSGHL